MSQEIGKRDGSSNYNPCSDASTVEKVFQIDEVREGILRYVICNSERKLSKKMINRVRLVQRSWLQTTNKLLRKIKEPVIELTVDGNCALKDAKDDKPKEKLLDQLVETFGTSPRFQEPFLPVKLHFKLDFFRERNHQSFSDFLTRFGNKVVELQLEYPKSGGTMPVIFPSFKLPLLQKLTFQFSDDRLKKDSNEDADGIEDNSKGLVLLQLILNASKGITNLIIPFTKSDDVVPAEFKYIRLPATISLLRMEIKLRSKDLQVLLRNQLPSLSNLTLLLHKVPFEDGLLFKILEPFRKTIEILQISGIIGNGHPNPPTLLRFPLMEKLKDITILSVECELGPGDVSALQLCLPGLETVQLACPTDVRLAKWIQKSTFKSVKQLIVSVVNEQLSWEHESFYIPPSLEILTQLHHSFPNMCRMTLAVNISDLTSLKHLFQVFIQLESLNITISGNKAVIATSSDLIDSIFLGLPLRLVATLKEEMRLLDNGTISINGGSEPSMRNLSELVNLTLCTVQRNDATLEEGMSLISDLLFRHCFMKMTKLRNLFLYKKFKPTSEMEGEWKTRGRFMKYIAE